MLSDCNRTYVELKLDKYIVISDISRYCNRTYVELKLVRSFCIYNLLEYIVIALM